MEKTTTGSATLTLPKAIPLDPIDKILMGLSDAKAAAKLKPYVIRLEFIEREIGRITSIILAKVQVRDPHYHDEQECANWRKALGEALDEYAKAVSEMYKDNAPLTPDPQGNN